MTGVWCLFSISGIVPVFGVLICLSRKVLASYTEAIIYLTVSAGDLPALAYCSVILCSLHTNSLSRPIEQKQK